MKRVRVATIVVCLVSFVVIAFLTTRRLSHRRLAPWQGFLSAPLISSAAAGAPPPYRRYPDLASAIRDVIPADARVIGFGELHQQQTATGAAPAMRSTLRAFSDDVVPVIAPRVSDLVMETWMVDPHCGAGAQVATDRVEQAMQRPASTKNELANQIRDAKLAGITVHSMHLSCTDYDTIAPPSGIDAEKLLDLVTRELRRIVLSAITHRDAEPGHRPWIAVYGGALHNARFPYSSTASWSYMPDVDAAAHGKYVEIDLMVPEIASADPLSKTEPWFPLVALASAHPGDVLVWQRGDRSFVFVLPWGRSQL